MGTQHVLREQQWLPLPIDEVFAFFSKAENLELITPPWLNFKIKSIDPAPIRAGTVIKYRLKLRRILPLSWTTDITIWEPPQRFVDVQRSGPYKQWIHEHRFAEERGGTRIFDEVKYELPFGFLGDMVHALYVKGDIRQIFAYRQKVIDDLLVKKSA